jgi:hypothetical protein
MYHGMPLIILADHGSVFTSKMWDSLCKREAIQLRLTPIESHNSNGACESRHGPLRKSLLRIKTFFPDVSDSLALQYAVNAQNRIKTDFPDVSDSLALQYAVKAQNYTSKPRGIAPSTLVFGTVPRALDVDPQSNDNRYRMMTAARAEYAQEMSEERIRTALTSRPPPSSSIMLNPGKDVLVWRENTGWVGPYILSRVDGKTAYIHDKEGEPMLFSVSKVKPFARPDASKTFGVHLSEAIRLSKPNGIENNDFPMLIQVVKLIYPKDSTANSGPMIESKINELRGLLD